MPCFHPLKGWRSNKLNPTGKRSIVFNVKEGFHDLRVEVPCGQCIGCRLERSRQWAIRCVHEASLYQANCFITLTYNDENLPEDGSLVIEDFQKFMKRLRKRFPGKDVVYDKDGKPTYPIRFFHCGEYGDMLGRPHYHACLFNFDFEDKKLFKVNNGSRLYRSEALEELWPYGYSMIGEVTFQSAAYVARYIMKKITGDKADEHYQGKKPEYTTMSRRPGIGKGWFDKFEGDVYPKDFITMNGKKLSAPKFYDRLFEITNPDEFKKIKLRRKTEAKKREDNNTDDRLITRQRVQEARLTKLKRPIEELQ